MCSSLKTIENSTSDPNLQIFEKNIFLYLQGPTWPSFNSHHNMNEICKSAARRGRILQPPTRAYGSYGSLVAIMRCFSISSLFAETLDHYLHTLMT